jgi:hypothetical protein
MWLAGVVLGHPAIDRGLRASEVSEGARVVKQLAPQRLMEALDLAGRPRRPGARQAILRTMGIASRRRAIVVDTPDPCDDPLWSEAGFGSEDEYRFWSRRICGLACLQSVLAEIAAPVMVKPASEGGSVGMAVAHNIGELEALLAAAAAADVELLAEPFIAAARTQPFDSEFSRFLLTHYGVPYHEERHVMPFHVFFTLMRGRTVRFPLLYGNGLRLNTVKKLANGARQTR